jgi:hypothetical protein
MCSSISLQKNIHSRQQMHLNDKQYLTHLTVFHIHHGTKDSPTKASMDFNQPDISRKQRRY